MAAYSAFFSSGLLAPHHSASPTNYYDAPSPARPSSPPIPDDSDIEVDTEREETPTPDVHPSLPPTTTQPRPRLRKRRSSITIGTSPMNAIRSPSRTAGAALQLQLHLPTSPSRSRSNSLSNATSTAQTDLYGGVGIGIGNVASEDTSLVGRMRSGSMGGAGLRQGPRRTVRRLAALPAPAAPPPTAPLPAIPSWVLSQASQLKPLGAPPYGSMRQHSHTNSITSIRPPLVNRRSSSDLMPMMKGRERGFSVSAGLRIDEEMKEN